VSAVAERTKEEQLLESWLDGEVPCMWRGCGSAATWRLIPICKHQGTCCSKHRRKFESPGIAYLCTTCNAITPPGGLAWMPL